MVTHKKATSRTFQSDLGQARGKVIVEQSYRDAFWGAKPMASAKGVEMLRGQNMLGHILNQLNDGATMELAPRGTIVLDVDMTQLRNIGALAAATTAAACSSTDDRQPTLVGLEIEETRKAQQFACFAAMMASRSNGR